VLTKTGRRAIYLTYSESTSVPRNGRSCKSLRRLCNNLASAAETTS